MFKKLLLTLSLLFAGTAAVEAQPLCSGVNFVSATGATPLAEVITGSPNQRIGICGIVLFDSGNNSADVQFFSGDPGTNCSSNGARLTPVLNMPNGGIFVDHIAYVMLSAPLGASACVVITGNGTISGLVYWTRY